MNNIKKLVACVLLTGFMQSCSGQAPKQDKQMETLINEISSHIVSYKNQPSYHADINSSACSFELLINDMPAYQFYSPGGVGVSVPVNPFILKSGKQTFTLRLYPGYYKEGKEVKQTGSFIKETKLNFTINLNHWNDKESESKDVFSFSLPSATNKDGFKEYNVAGGKYMEYTGTFEAEVPYALKGWTESAALIGEADSARLEKEVVAAYTELTGYFKQKKFDQIVRENQNGLTERFQSIYHGQQAEVKASIDKYARESDNPTYEVKALEDYTMRIYGNGKVVCLERADRKNKGESVVRIGYTNEEGKKRLYYYGFYFHRPHKGAPLEPIR